MSTPFKNVDSVVYIKIQKVITNFQVITSYEFQEEKYFVYKCSTPLWHAILYYLNKRTTLIASLAHFIFSIIRTFFAISAVLSLFQKKLSYFRKFRTAPRLFGLRLCTRPIRNYLKIWSQISSSTASQC